ncbi:hypothetical protein IMSAG049_01046 [Clostridiales bacterium]|nr:hypothetical protein IMSAG049_01046 [Clostridiales bacterium]
MRKCKRSLNAEAVLNAGEKIFCFEESKVNDITRTRNTKLLFIEQLQMAGANVQLLSHFIDNSLDLESDGPQRSLLAKGKINRDIIFKMEFGKNTIWRYTQNGISSEQK